MSQRDVVRGAYLASQHIRKAINNGGIIIGDCRSVDADLEKRIQPASLDAAVTDELFVLDTDGLFRPRRGETVYRSLLERVPSSKRQRVDISDGYEVRRGFNYLLRLDSKISGKNPGFRAVKSSPKSSMGRLFAHTRLIADRVNSFDEFQVSSGKDTDMWVLLQPYAFNLIVAPGITLNQLRFLRGGDPRLTVPEMADVWKEYPMIRDVGSGGALTPAEFSTLGDTLPVKIDIRGETTFGIVALRARDNPNPIDLRVEDQAPSEDYFEHVEGKNGVVKIEKGKHYLLASQGVLTIPNNLSVSLRPTSHLGLDARLHLAGFIDPGFTGDLVFEVTSREETDAEVENGTPFGELDIFRTSAVPDKVYGKKIGSHYHGQRGLRIAKYVAPFKFDDAAKASDKLNRDVLVQDAKVLLGHRKNPNRIGFEHLNESQAHTLIDDVERRGFLVNRYECERDPLILQVIPYVLAFDRTGKVFAYERSSGTGDPRLKKKWSIGLGGHISRLDSPNYLRRCLEREVFDEEARIIGDHSDPKLVGTLYHNAKPVDRVHFGMVYAFLVDGTISSREESSVSPGSERMYSLAGIRGEKRVEFETWSRVLIPHLGRIYDTIRKG